jgi:hypothetical protein
MNRWVCLAATFLFLAVTSCDQVIEGSPFQTGPGRTCHVDEDCVPDDCCGEGEFAVHVEDAPDCSGVVCAGSCDPSMVRCGCGIPLCHDMRCAVAVTVSPQCPN